MLMNKRAKMAAMVDGEAVGAILSHKGHITHIGHDTNVPAMAFQLEQQQPHTNGLIGATFPEKSLVELCDVKAQHDDPLNWGKVAAGLAGSHVEEVKAMAATFFECREVVLEGAGLSVAQVAAIARRPQVKVVLDAVTAKARVDESSDWVLSCAMKGTDTYGVTTGTSKIPPEIPQNSTSITSSHSPIPIVEFMKQRNWLPSTQTWLNMR